MHLEIANRYRNMIHVITTGILSEFRVFNSAVSHLPQESFHSRMIRERRTANDDLKNVRHMTSWGLRFAVIALKNARDKGL